MYMSLKLDELNNSKQSYDDNETRKFIRKYKATGVKAASAFKQTMQ